MKKKFLRGFTLIELLVVITIIGILAGLAIPTISGVLDAAKKTEAKVFMSSLQTAMVHYQTEYNVYPSFIPTNGLIETTKWQDFYKVFVKPSNLTTTDTDNSRRIIFIESIQSKYLKPDPNDPGSATYFVDPWDQYYKMWVDTDYDNELTGLPDLSSATASATKDIPGSVAVYSFGNDRGEHTKKSIGTWK